VDKIAASRTDFALQQVVQSLTHARRIERHLLAYRQRGCMVIDAESEQLHGDGTLRRRESEFPNYR
jgi:hypothetical protein